MIIDATTETGSRYRIDYERGLWAKISRNGYQLGPERIWDLRIGTSLTRPWDSPDDWETGELPVVGKHLYLSGKDVWYVSTVIQEVVEVDSWKDDAYEQDMLSSEEP